MKWQNGIFDRSMQSVRKGRHHVINVARFGYGVFPGLAPQGHGRKSGALLNLATANILPRVNAPSSCPSHALFP